MWQDKLTAYIQSCDKCTGTDCAIQSVLPSVVPVDKLEMMLIGYNPNSYEAIMRNFLTGRNADYFFSVLKACRVNPAACYTTTIVKGFFQDGKPGVKVAGVCSERFFVRELKHYKPAKVIIFGAETFNAMFHKDMTFSDCVNKVINTPWFDALILYSPNYFEHVGVNSTQYQAFCRAIKSFVEYRVGEKRAFDGTKLKELKTIGVPKVLQANNDLDAYDFVDYRNSADALRKFDAVVMAGKAVSFDLETRHLYIDAQPFESFILNVGVCNDKKQALSIDAKDLTPADLKELWRRAGLALKTKPIIGANLKFDLKPWIRALSKYRMKHYDVATIMFLVNELEMSYGLKQMLNRIFNLPDYGYNWSETDPASIDPRERRVYNCRDAYWTMELFKYAWPMLTKKQQALWHSTLGDNIASFSFMEVCGLPYNAKINKHIRKFVSNEIAIGHARLESWMKSNIGIDTLNTKSGDQIYRIMQHMKWKYATLDRTKTRISCDADNMAKFLEENSKNKVACKFADQVLAETKLRTILSKFDGKNALSKFIHSDGRLRCNWRITGTKTGRPSTSNPNILNIERADSLPLSMQSKVERQPRHQFYTDKDTVLVGFDLSQAELRVLTCYSRDKAFMRVYNSGGDAHTDTGQTIAKYVDLVWETIKDWMRQAAKTLNFGRVYQQSAKGMRDECNKIFALKGLSIRLTLEQCEEFLGIWNNEVHPEAAAWIDGFKEKSMEKGYAESYFGRRRHFAFNDRRSAELREAVNHPVQSVACDIVNDIMNKVRIAGASKIPGYRLVKHEYDALYNQVQVRYKDEMLGILREATKIEIGDYDGFIIIPFVADFAVGRSFATMAKIHD
jgi:DNA polymerase I-like protein with 3'-5' exonuclease and polymerase domains